MSAVLGGERSRSLNVPHRDMCRAGEETDHLQSLVASVTRLCNPKSLPTDTRPSAALIGTVNSRRVYGKGI